MTQKERLVEDVKLQIFAALGNVNCDTCVYKDYDMEPCRFCHIEYNQWAISKDTLQNLAEGIVKRAIKNGVIVPPCKVGDTVYVIDDGSIYQEKIDFFDLSVYTYNGVYSIEDVFLSREAAKQALKEYDLK